MKRIRARYIVDQTIDWAWENLFGQFVLVFDDGEEIVTNARETQFSNYAWDFHRMYPETPLLAKHHAQHVLKGGLLNSGTHLDMLGHSLWSVYDAYIVGNYQARILTYDPVTGRVTEEIKEEVILRESLSRMAYELTNKIYNELTYRCEEYVVSLDITDFTRVLAHPIIREINNNLENTQASIKNAYKVVRDTIRNDPALAMNPLSLAVRSKTVKEDQLLQCITARGYLTDTDSHIFKYPVLRGYARGLRSLYASMIESRSAAKSLAFSKTQLQDAEYFSRRLQLVSQKVQRLVMGDCGSNEYLGWLVRDKLVENGRLKREGDLKYIKGKRYLDDDGVLKTVHEDDKHLIGRKLRFRTPLRCWHRALDPYSVCSTCFGDLAFSVPAGSNIGHMCCTHLTQKLSQSVLSLKHIDMNSEVDGIILDANERRILRASADDNSFVLAPDMKSAHITLVVAPSQALGITDVRDVEEVEQLSIMRVSEMETIDIRIDDGGLKETITVNVKRNNRNASMTLQLLDHIKVFGFGIDDNTGNYLIDMTNWDWTQPILTLPMKHFNMSDHAAAIARMLESTVKESEDRDKNTSPEAFLRDFHDLVNDKLDVNLAVHEIVVLGISIRSAEEYDYRLPAPGTDYGLGVRSNIMTYGSLASTMAFEKHRDIFLSPMSYLVPIRPDHPMDGVLMPAEVAEVEEHYHVKL